MAQATLYRPSTGKLQLYTPFKEGTRKWLNETVGPRAVDHKGGGKWEIAATHFRHSFFVALAERFGSVRVTNVVGESRKCTKECADAKRETAPNCECICLGANHGQGEAGWTHVGQRLLISPGVVGLVTTIYSSRARR